MLEAIGILVLILVGIFSILVIGLGIIDVLMAFWRGEDR